MGKYEDIIGKDPDKIIQDREENGVWVIPWTWKEYPEEFAIAKNWWKADLAIGRVKLLKKLGIIE